MKKTALSMSSALAAFSSVLWSVSLFEKGPLVDLLTPTGWLRVDNLPRLGSWRLSRLLISR